MYKEAFPPAVETTLRDKDDDDEGEGGLRWVDDFDETTLRDKDDDDEGEGGLRWVDDFDDQDDHVDDHVVVFDDPDDYW